MRVVLDTNVIVSAILSPAAPPFQIVTAWRDGLLDVLVTEQLLAEYRRALAYPKVQRLHKISDDQLDRLIRSYRLSGLFVRNPPVVHVVEDDPDDDMILACAIGGSATYIITRDQNLLKLGEYHGIAITSPLVFMRIF